MRYCLLTNDVEKTSIKTNTLNDSTAERVLKDGMPALIGLYKKYGVKSTFFFTGDIAEQFPDIVRLILKDGHEVGCHGYTHEVDKSFDILSLEEQKEHLKKSKGILEDISGQEVISFRAPALRVNNYTVQALTETGFKIDSSVASQRFDMFLSFGSREKTRRLFSPRLAYKTEKESLYKRGNSGIIEIPISALMLPYIGTTLRIFPSLTRMTRTLLHFENKINNKPINFLTHPNEFIDEAGDVNIKRRAKGFISYLLKDLLRQRLKLKNLGKSALPLYEREIEFFKKKEYKFSTVKEYAFENNLLNH